MASFNYDFNVAYKCFFLTPKPEPTFKYRCLPRRLRRDRHPLFRLKIRSWLRKPPKGSNSF